MTDILIIIAIMLSPVLALVGGVYQARKYKHKHHSLRDDRVMSGILVGLFYPVTILWCVFYLACVIIGFVAVFPVERAAQLCIWLSKKLESEQ